MKSHAAERVTFASHDIVYDKHQFWGTKRDFSKSCVRYGVFAYGSSAFDTESKSRMMGSVVPLTTIEGNLGKARKQSIEVRDLLPTDPIQCRRMRIRFSPEALKVLGVNDGIMQLIHSFIHSWKKPRILLSE